MVLYGDLAQLGERLPCTQEVRSSILLVSTISDKAADEFPVFIRILYLEN